jgi:hypothetical protein
MEKRIRIFRSFAEAEAAEDEAYSRMTPQRRLQILIELHNSAYQEVAIQSWREYLEALQQDQVEFLLVGAVAVAWHGHPRLTRNLDIFLPPTVQLSPAPNGICLHTSLSGVEWNSAWASTIEAHLDGLPVNFIGLGALIRNKEATGRPRDLADAATLRQRNP